MAVKRKTAKDKKHSRKPKRTYSRSLAKVKNKTNNQKNNIPQLLAADPISRLLDFLTIVFFSSDFLILQDLKNPSL